MHARSIVVPARRHSRGRARPADSASRAGPRASLQCARRRGRCRRVADPVEPPVGRHQARANAGQPAADVERRRAAAASCCRRRPRIASATRADTRRARGSTRPRDGRASRARPGSPRMPDVRSTMCTRRLRRLMRRARWRRAADRAGRSIAVAELVLARDDHFGGRPTASARGRRRRSRRSSRRSRGRRPR